MVEINQEKELARIAEKIVGLAEARKDERRPYLVSALGIDLGEDLRRLKLLTNQGLNEFIKSRLTGRVTLVWLGDHQNVAAIIFGSVDPTTVELPKISDEEKKRFQFRFWAAFSVPPEKDVRVLNMDNFTFEDFARDDVPEDAVTIDHALIAPSEEKDRDALIKSNIYKWLASKELPEERFLAPQKLLRPAIKSMVSTKGSLLELLITALDRKQLQSTSLSLDVIATLLHTPSN